MLDLETNVVFYEDIFSFATGQSPSGLYIFSLPSASSKGIPAVENSYITVVDQVPINFVEDVVVDSKDEIDVAGNKRSSKQLAYLQDYFCNMTTTDIPYPLAAYLSYDHLLDEYRDYVCALTKLSEPTSFKQAKTFEEWLQAMNEELQALESTNTWDIGSLPPDKHAIGCK